MKVWVKTGHLFFINLGLYPKKGEAGQITAHLKRPGRSTREWTRCKLEVDHPPAVARANSAKLRRAIAKWQAAERRAAK